MNAKELEDMAYKARFWTADTAFGGVCWMGYHAELQRFADLVAAHEREELLDLVDAYAKNNDDLKVAIRARGQA